MKTLNRLGLKHAGMAVALTIALLIVFLLWAGYFGGGVFKSASDLLVFVGDGIGMATFLLAAVAGLVAVRAYQLSLSSPKLGLEIDFPLGFAGVMVEKLEAARGYAAVARVPFTSGHWLRILIRNQGDCSAHDPRVRIEFIGMLRLRQPQNGWTFVSPTYPESEEAIEWKGLGGDAIPGHSVQELPYLDVSGAMVAQTGTVAFIVDYIAERFVGNARWQVQVRWQ